MATVDKNFRVKNGIVVEGSTATVNGSNVLTEASTEFLQDTVAGMVDGTHTNLTVSYNDTTGKLTFTAENGVGDSTTDNLSEGSTNKYFTDERAQDAIGTVVGNGLSYDDTTGAISVNTSTIQARVTDVSDTEIGYLNGVTSAIQTQLDDKSTASKTETFTNKTITSPVVSGLTLSDGSIVLEGATDNAFETALTVTDPTADRTVTLPDASGTVALTNNKLDVFAATTSAELAGVISDETGTGALVFANTPTLVTPNIGAATGTSLVLSGDLTVNGTTTTINSTEITVDDKNLTLGSVATPTDAGADGGGITLKGATDKTFNWIDSTDSWTSSEHINLASGKSLKINGTDLKDVAETLTNKTLTSPIVDGNGVVFEGATANDFETTLSVTDPTADRTITLPDVSGTIITTGDTGSVTNTMLAGSIANDKLANSAITINGTSTSLGGTRTLVTDDIAEDGSPSNLWFTSQRAVDALQAVVPDFTAVEVNNISKQVAATVSLSDTNAATAYSWAKADYRAAKFLVKFAYGTHTEVSEVLLTLDTSDNIGITEYAVVTTNGSLGDVTADISGSDVRIRVTAGTATTTCHVVGTLIR